MAAVMQNATAGLRSKSPVGDNRLNRGLRWRSTPGYTLEAHTRFSFEMPGEGRFTNPIRA